MTNRLFVQSNDPAGNQILVHERAEDGGLTLAGTIDTSGVGGRNGRTDSDPLPLGARSPVTQLGPGSAVCVGPPTQGRR